MLFIVFCFLLLVIHCIVLPSLKFKPQRLCVYTGWKKGLKNSLFKWNKIFYWKLGIVYCKGRTRVTLFDKYSIGDSLDIDLKPPKRKTFYGMNRYFENFSMKKKFLLITQRLEDLGNIIYVLFGDAVPIVMKYIISKTWVTLLHRWDNIDIIQQIFNEIFSRYWFDTLRRKNSFTPIERGIHEKPC